MRKKLVVIGFATVVVALGLQLRETKLPTATAAPLRALCGSERWSVKTFSDADRFKVDLTPRSRTIKQLNALIKPIKLPATGRVPAELKVYRVTATVTATINENDSDIHLALMAADGSTLIAEAPEPACSINARDRASINQARLVAQDVQVSDTVVAVGVGFFDFPHNQTGHATNQIELHPLISLRRL